MYDITLHRLRVFKCVIETGGVRAAANLLGISQPSVSAHVHGLEAVVGQPLLDRRPGKSGSLTDAGRIVYNYAHDAVVGVDSVSALLKELRVGGHGSVTFAATRTLGNTILSQVLTKFHRGSPGVLVSVRTGRLSEVTDLVLTGGVAFGIALTSGPIPPLDTEVLREDPVVLLARPTHPLASLEKVDMHDLESAEMFVSLRASENARSTMGALRASGFTYRNIAIETDDYVALKRVAIEGTGVTVLPLTSATHEVERGELVQLPTTFSIPPLELRMMRLPRRRFTSCEQAAITLVRTQLAEVPGA